MSRTGAGNAILPKPLLLYIAHLAHLADIDDLEERMDLYDHWDEAAGGLRLPPNWIRLDSHHTVRNMCNRPRCKYRRLYHELKKWIK